MANKHKKNPANPKKHHHRDAVKKHEKEAEIQQFCSQLDALGITAKIIQVTADGNCFFRALADQLTGNEEEHKNYREMVVHYIMNHHEDFKPFIEDDVPFDEYCDSMKKDGTWAGHMELQAASLVTRRNICIHQIMAPRWYIRNFSGRDVGMIHLSYHNDHYNSIRLKEDSCEGPAKPIIIKEDADISAKDHNTKLKSTHVRGTSHRLVADNQSVKVVMAGTGCQNADKVEQVLQEVDGDVDAAIEFLIAEKEMSETIDHCDENPSQSNTCNGDNQEEKSEKLKVVSVDINSEESTPNSDCQSDKDQSIQRDDKKIGRNKECSCGSRKKCKACCGSVVGKSSTVPVVMVQLAG